MSRIKKTFEVLKASGRKALVTFTMAGDPSIEDSLAVLKSLPEAGADLIEIGMPFTDPAADGLTIQHAGQRALKAGATMKTTLQMVRDFREGNDHTPIILMGYANPLYAYGLENFAKDAKKSGVDGLIIVDLPPEEDHELRQFTDALGLDMIRLVTPTTDEARLPVILNGASGFLYYVSITGVTGTKKADIATLKPHIDMIRGKTNLPIAIGFGIRTPNDAQEMSVLGDAVVVGSSIVEKVKDIGENGEGMARITDLVCAISSILGERPDEG
ncbi:MAG: tryptophan synthase subunit alpha [Zetaproteobacteria bacterium]|nr:MAG: tryptophan synthase subunit alpha [Zetaproteobacteria bacterium]